MDLALDLAGGGGGGGWAPGDGLSWWCPDLPSATPHAMDDDFNAATLNAKWTALSPGGNLTVDGGRGGGVGSLDTVEHALRFTNAGNGAANRIGMIVQALPGGFAEGAFYGKVNPIAQAVNTTRCGLCIGPATLVSAPTTTNFHSVAGYCFNASDAGAISETWTNYTTLGVTTLKYASFFGDYYRMRIVFTGGNWVLERDVGNGVKWWRLATTINLPYTPGVIGFMADCTATGALGVFRAPFFRAFTGAGTSGADATQIGRRVSLAIAT